MASYQDIESRLRTVESKLDFLMSAGQVTKREKSFLDPRGFTETQMSMLDLYREVMTQAGSLVSEPISEMNENG